VLLEKYYPGDQVMKNGWPRHVTRMGGEERNM
jgi:hypothetical protein